MKYVRLMRSDGIAEVVLDRPPVNAIVEPLIDELLSVLAEVRADDTIRAMVLRAAGPGPFCAGLDLLELDGRSPEHVHDLLEKLYIRVSEAQARLGKPSIAAVDGAARGGGMTLAILCDLIVAGEKASFGYPEIDVGLLPAIHFSHLPRIVGRHRAFDLLFTARSFGAVEAQTLGLVSRVVPAGEAAAKAVELARLLAAKPVTAMRRGRAAFYREFEAGLQGSAAVAVQTFTSAALTREARESVSAFASRPKKRGG